MPTEFSGLLLLRPLHDITHSKNGRVIEQLQGWLDLDIAMSIHSVLTKGSHIIAVCATATSRYLYILVSELVNVHTYYAYH